MNELDCQTAYWNRVADTKTFSHPIKFDVFEKLVPCGASILDYGCGYGRTCAELVAGGYPNVVGADISRKMIERGLQGNPSLNLVCFDGGELPFADESFDACMLLAVLTCIPSDAGQAEVLRQLHRVLRPGGVLYVSDYPLQDDERNAARYRSFESEFRTYGVFRLPDGAVVRHHDMARIAALLGSFDTLQEERFPVITMNGNPAQIFQVIARKKS